MKFFFFLSKVDCYTRNGINVNDKQKENVPGNLKKIRSQLVSVQVFFNLTDSIHTHNNDNNHHTRVFLRNAPHATILSPTSTKTDGSVIEREEGGRDEEDQELPVIKRQKTEETSTTR